MWVRKAGRLVRADDGGDDQQLKGRPPANKKQKKSHSRRGGNGGGGSSSSSSRRRRRRRRRTGGGGSHSSLIAPPPLPTDLDLASLGAYNISRVTAFLPDREMTWVTSILRLTSFTSLDVRHMDLRSLTLLSTREHTIRALRCARFYNQGPHTARGATSHGLRRAPAVRAITLDIGRNFELSLLPSIVAGFDPAVLKVIHSTRDSVPCRVP